MTANEAKKLEYPFYAKYNRTNTYWIVKVQKYIFRTDMFEVASKVAHFGGAMNVDRDKIEVLSREEFPEYYL